MRLDLASEGGGSKGAALIGALAEIERRGHEVARWTGTSAGAIFSLLGAVGYSSTEMAAVMGRAGLVPMLKLFADPPRGFPLRAASSLWSLRTRGGLFMGGAFERWLEDRIAAKGFARWVSLGDLWGLGRMLTVVAFDADAGRELDLNGVTMPRMGAARAVRMSMSIPGVWRAVVAGRERDGLYKMRDIGGHRCVDGGVRNNLPLNLIADPLRRADEAGLGPLGGVRPVGLMLDEGAAPHSPLGAARGALDPEHRLLGSVGRLIAGPALAYAVRLFDGMLNAGNLETMDRWPEHVCRIPVKGTGTLEPLTPAKVLRLADSGRRAMAAHLDGIG